MEAAQSLTISRMQGQLHALNEVAKTLTLPLELEELLDQVLGKIIGVFEPAETGLVMLWDQSSGLFRPRAAFGYNRVNFKNLGFQAGEGITGKAFDQNKPLLLDNRQEVETAMQDIRPGNLSILRNALGRDPLPLCSLAVPVFVREQKFGVLLLETFEGPQVFTSADLPILQSVADLIALAIDRIRLQLKADTVRVSREADRLRAEVTATLSHELRLPLTAIKGYTTMLLLDDIEWTREKYLHYLQMVEEEVDSMESMIKDILDSSLIDVGQLKLEPQPVRLQYIARDVANEIQRFTDNHHLVVDFPADFPLLEADPRWIKQVFRNILENAIKYSPDGGLIVVRGEVRNLDVVIRVADQGVGISPEDLIPLFEKYFRVRSSSTFHVSGTGLGLPVARSIVESHGGRIWAESHLGQGTTLYFSLPKMKMDNGED